MSVPKGWLVLLLALVSVCPVGASERDALAVSRNIRMLRMPFGTILDPVFPSSAGTQIVGYSRCTVRHASS